MAIDGLMRRLLVGLADRSPAFTPAPVKVAGRGIGVRLLAALADATPAFRPGQASDEYIFDSSVRTAAGASQPVAELRRVGLRTVAENLSSLSLAERLRFRVWMPVHDIAKASVAAATYVRARGLLREIASRRGSNAEATARVLARQLQIGTSYVVESSSTNPWLFSATLAEAIADDLDKSIAELSGDDDLFRRIHRRSQLLVEETLDLLIRAVQRVTYRSDEYAPEVVHQLATSLNLPSDGQELATAEALMLIDRIVNDVSGEDLRELDVGAFPLDGLRWSHWTRWPAGWAERVSERSIQVEKDLFVIDAGEHDVRAHQQR